jgi:hypothetical protein
MSVGIDEIMPNGLGLSSARRGSLLLQVKINEMANIRATLLREVREV